MLLCAADIAATEPSLDMAARLAADVPVNRPARFRQRPWRALVDCSAAARVIGWQPRYTWSGRGKGHGSGKQGSGEQGSG
jgi:nucleoside-diphosphate-sugar epimerase